MSRHVVLLTDAHEAPAYELIEALRAAGVKTLIEGLRDVEIEVALAQQREREGNDDSGSPGPLAVLHEVVPGADMVELHTDHALFGREHLAAAWHKTASKVYLRVSTGTAPFRLRTKPSFPHCFERLKATVQPVSFAPEIVCRLKAAHFAASERRPNRLRQAFDLAFIAFHRRSRERRTVHFPAWW
jgi:hypothetical protein